MKKRTFPTTITVNSIQGKGFSQRGYMYTIDRYNFNCADSFLGRGTTLTIDNATSYVENFITGIKIISIDNKSTTKKTKFFDDFPEFANVVKHLKGKIEGNCIYGKNYYHTVAFFRLLRLCVSPKKYELIQLISQLCDEGYPVLQAYLMASIKYRIVSFKVKSYPRLNNGNELLYFNNQAADSSSVKWTKMPNTSISTVLPPDVDEWIHNILPRVRVFQYSWPDFYHRTIPTFVAKSHSGTLSIGHFRRLTNKEDREYYQKNKRKMNDTVRKIYNYASKDKWDKMAELLPITKYY